MTLWHYTCDHGRTVIGDAGTLLPGAAVYGGATVWTGTLLWLTDLARPNRLGLGLSSLSLSCDRTQHRYRVTDDANVQRWTTLARTLPRAYREPLEAAVGAMPAHWWVSADGVPAVYDPVIAR